MKIGNNENMPGILLEDIRSRINGLFITIVASNLFANWTSEAFAFGFCLHQLVAFPTHHQMSTYLIDHYRLFAKAYLALFFFVGLIRLRAAFEASTSFKPF